MTKFTPEQIEQIKKNTVGRTVNDLYYEKDGDYYVMVFDDGFETCFRFMADLCDKE